MQNNNQYGRVLQELKSSVAEHSSPSLKIPLTVNASSVFCE